MSSKRCSALAVGPAPPGITADTLSPGTVRTPVDGAFPFDRDAVRTAYRERIPLGRYSVPDENMGALLLFAPDAGAYLNGARIVVDGGVLAGQTHRMRFHPPHRVRGSRQPALPPSGGRVSTEGT
ncbi:SDR family oxidoreductase [Streptomyces sp. ML-6]|uniref:SDR family oxidoreductase n=1 Tax=Streptomyces sp. ML-6 TaxID=2982693 RepID=UPI0024BFFEE6|nr:SDR family oxidoreductase [Streptomyces sp. ML-6]MDK0517647.1 SDR family oxidoreductase [Streptomyces sp. ML-6]